MRLACQGRRIFLLEPERRGGRHRGAWWRVPEMRRVAEGAGVLRAMRGRGGWHPDGLCQASGLPVSAVWRGLFELASGRPGATDELRLRGRQVASAKRRRAWEKPAGTCALSAHRGLFAPRAPARWPTDQQREPPKVRFPDPDERVRRHALQMLSGLPMSSLRPMKDEIALLLDDPSMDVKRLALRVLDTIEPTDRRRAE